jgi:hypothetical protein
VVIEAVKFEPVASTKWSMRVTIFGQDFEERAIPLVAQVGDQTVQALSPLFDGTGVSGLLINEPAADDEVKIGYADGPLVETGFKYELVG